MIDKQQRGIGPWKWRPEDIRSLNRLCQDALAPEFSPAGGLLNSKEASRQSPHVVVALKAIHAHTIYKCLKKHMADVLARVPADDALHDVRLVQQLLQLLSIAWFEQASDQSGESEKKGDRPDKRRTRAYSAIECVEQHLNDGTIWLKEPDLTKLRNLLAQARKELASPRPKPVGQPALLALTHRLYHQFGVADAALLRRIADSAGIDCPEWTARPYVNEALKG